MFLNYMVDFSKMFEGFSFEGLADKLPLMMFALFLGLALVPVVFHVIDASMLDEATRLTIGLVPALIIVSVISFMFISK